MSEALAADGAPVTPVGTEVPAGAAPADKPVVPQDTSLELADPITETPAATDTEFVPTGDAAMDLALEFITGLGIGMSDPAILAAEKGDFTALEAKLKGLGDKAKGWERRVSIGKNYIAGQAKEAEAKIATDAAAIHDAVGGKEQWAEIKAWAIKATADSPHERAEVNKGLAMGGAVGKAVAMMLLQKFQKSTGTVVRPTASTKAATAARPAAQADGVMTAKAYVKAVEGLRSKLGYGFEGSSEYKALQSQRHAARLAGK